MPQEKNPEDTRRVKARISGVKRGRKFIDYWESSGFARGLEELVEDIRACNSDPKKGVELAVAFYKLDRNVFERCDDSNGAIGDVFRHDARLLFIEHAKLCSDKDWLSEVVRDLYCDNPYGAHDGLLESAGEFLPQDHLTTMVDWFWNRTKSIDDSEEHADFRRRDCYRGVETLARQLGDAPLFEKARRAGWDNLNIVACMDIARVYLETGDAKTALEWLTREETEILSQWRDKYDNLLYEVYKALGDEEHLKETAWQIFRTRRTELTFEKLLETLGEEERGRVLEEETRAILEQDKFDFSDVFFLLASGKTDESAAYVLKHQAKLNGDLYDSVLPIAENLEAHEQWLASIVSYRALLDSILTRANSKYYHHGVRYLKKIDTLAEKVKDYDEVQAHSDYVKEIVSLHHRKRSFWESYGGLPE